MFRRPLSARRCAASDTPITAASDTPISAAFGASSPNASSVRHTDFGPLGNGLHPLFVDKEDAKRWGRRVLFHRWEGMNHYQLEIRYTIEKFPGLKFCWGSGEMDNSSTR